MTTLFPEPIAAPAPSPARAIRFTVYGKSEPAGSKRAFMLKRKDGSPVTRENGTPIINVTDDNSKSKGWKQQVAYAARQAFRGELLEGAIRLTLRFVRVRNKGHYTPKGALSATGRNTPYPITKPDVLKLARGVEDALTEVVWNDDAQIVDERLIKEWGSPARVEITIEQLP